MRINIAMGFFLPVPPVAGGATEKSWHGLAREFVRAGHAVTLISRDWPGWSRDETVDGVRYLREPGQPHTAQLARNLWRDFWWSWRVRRALPPADVTIAHSVALPLLLGWSRRRTGALVVTPGRMPKGQFRLYRHIDRVYAVSTPVRDALLAENPALAARTSLSGYPIHWEHLAAPRLPNAVLTIGYVGRIHREKGLVLLVEALRNLTARRNLPRWRVLFCGPSDVARGGSGDAFAEELRGSLGSFLSAGDFELRPPVFDDAQLAGVYRSIDVFGYPSLALRGETFGVAVAEAMAAGAVPVVSALPCFSDFVRAEENALVFDHAAATASTALADALGRLLADAALRTRLARNAQATARAYDYPVFAQKLLDDFAALHSSAA